MQIGKIEIPEPIAENCELLKVDGYDDCCVGYMERFGMEPILCYDKDLMLRQMVEEGMTGEEACEHFEFNIIGAFVGDATPCFLSKGEHIHAEACTEDPTDRSKDILVRNVGVSMFRKQRNTLLRLQDFATEDDSSFLNGLVELLDHMLDRAEGFPELPADQIDEFLDDWNVESLQTEFPDITVEEARKALFLAKDKYDANYGVSYETFEEYLEEVRGDSVERVS